MALVPTSAAVRMRGRSAPRRRRNLLRPARAAPVRVILESPLTDSNARGTLYYTSTPTRRQNRRTTPPCHRQGARICAVSHTVVIAGRSHPLVYAELHSAENVATRWSRLRCAEAWTRDSGTGERSDRRRGVLRGGVEAHSV